MVALQLARRERLTPRTKLFGSNPEGVGHHQGGVFSVAALESKATDPSTMSLNQGEAVAGLDKYYPTGKSAVK